MGEEVFGPLGLVVRVSGIEQMQELAKGFQGQLTMTLHMDEGDTEAARKLVPIIERKAGRLLINGFPTGVGVRTPWFTAVLVQHRRISARPLSALWRSGASSAR